VLTSNVLPSLYVPVAFSAWFVPNAIDGFDGVIPSDTNAGGPTVNAAVPLMLPKVALIVVCPAVIAVAPPELLMPATPVADESQVTNVVRSCMPPSV